MEQKNFEDPFERARSFGPSFLTDAELLSLFLRAHTSGEDACRMARQILSETGGTLLSLMRAEYERLLEVPGIGPVKALLISALKECVLRISREKYVHQLILSDPSSVANYYMERFRHESREHLTACYFNCRGALISEELIAVGTIDGASFSVREVLSPALLHKASYMILIHNHPSGDASPSHEDQVATERILAAGALLQIPLADHIILGDREFFSFKEHGLLIKKPKGAFQ